MFDLLLSDIDRSFVLCCNYSYFVKTTPIC